MGRLRASGTGAARQRAILARGGSVADVVDWLAAQRRPGGRRGEARRDRRRRGRDVGRVAGPQAARPGRAGDRRVRAGPLHVVLGLRHPVLDRRAGQGPRRAGRPRRREAYRESRHRRAASGTRWSASTWTAREVVARDLDAAAARSARASTSWCTRPARSRSTPEWARIDGGGVFGVQTLDDGAAIHAWLDRDPQPRTGGGDRRRLHRRRDGRGDGPARPRRSRCWRRRAQPMSHRRPRHGRAGPRGDLRAGHRGAHRTRTSRAWRPRTAGSARWSPPDGTLPADIVVLGLGVRPNTALAADCRPPARA